jgi:hypothetical protein
MSVQAITWATQQVTGRSVIKFVLVAIANYADDAGKCWPSQQRLAEDTEQSVDSVQRALKELKRLGLLYATPRRQKGTGYRAADYLILLMSEEAKAIAEGHGWNPDAVDESDAEENHTEDISPQPARGSEAKAADCGVGFSPSLHRNQPEPTPQLCGSRTTNEPSLKPPTPNQTISSSRAWTEPTGEKTQTPTPRSWLADWTDFEQLWPFKPTEPKEACRKTLQRTPPDERARILAGTRKYLEDARAHGRPIVSGKRFLREKFWEPFVDANKRKRAPNELIWVQVGTPAFEAWQAHKRATGAIAKWQNLVSFERRGADGRSTRGTWCPTLFPPKGARDGPAAAADSIPDNVQF